MRPLRVSAPPWAWLAMLAGCAAFAALGVWQIRRGEQKAALIAHYKLARHAPATILDANSRPPATTEVRRGRAAGVYLPGRQLLLDGQSHGNDSGYDVLTPLRLDDGALLLVNRGWIPAVTDRDHPPDPAPPVGRQQVSGLWRKLPQPALRLGGDSGCPGGGWPKLLSYPTVHDLRCLYGPRVLPGELLLDPDVAGGFVRDWRVSPGFPPRRHYGYAVQWFAFIPVLLFIFFRRYLRRSR